MDGEPDGCTAFVDEWRGHDIRPCCDAHDYAWWQLTNIQDPPMEWWEWLSSWFWSNWDLMVCFIQAGAWDVAGAAFFLVSTVGTVLFIFLRNVPLVKFIKEIGARYGNSNK